MGAQVTGTPRASVLLSTYNERPDFLELAIASILDQSFADFEVVLIDDGSDAPATCAALDRLSGRDPRLRVLREPRRGFTASLNVGLGLCRGDIIFRHDTDDWSEFDRFARQIAFLDAHPGIALVGTGAVLHQEDGSPLWPVAVVTAGEAIRSCFHVGNPFVHGAVAVRRHCLVEQGGYRPEFRVSQDYDCFWRLADRYEVANLPERLYHHRITIGAVSSNLGTDGGQIFFTFLAQELGHQRRGLGEDMVVAQQAAGARLKALDLGFEALLRQADRAVLAGRVATALRLFLRAVVRYPSQRRGWLKAARAIVFMLSPPQWRPRLFQARS